MNKKLAIIFITVFVDLVGFGIIIPLNPYLAKVFGADPLWAGLLMSIYSLMQFFFSPFWGGLSDRKGRRPIILISLLGAAVSHLGFAFSTTYWALFACRCFAGIFGGNLSAAMAYIADVTPPKERSKGMGLIGAAFGLGFVLGPAIGGLFAQVGERLGDHPPFGGSFSAVIAGLICFSNFVFAYFYLPESRQPNSTPVDRGHRVQKILSSLVRPELGRMMVLSFLNTFALAQLEVPLFLLVQGPFHWSYVSSSLGFAYIGVIGAFTQGYLIRIFLPKLGELKMAKIGFILMAIGMTGVGLSGSVPALAVAVTLLGLGYGMSTPSLSGSISLLSNADEQGGNLGVSQSLSSIARILGPGIGGYLFQSVGMSTPFLISGLVAALALMLSFFVTPRLEKAVA